MGLDMYLTARRTTFQLYGNGPVPSDRQVMVAAAEQLGLPASDNIDTIALTREIGYWRKANAIHAWFVTNVQDGKDDCGIYYVGRENLEELRNLCQQVIDRSQIKKGPIIIGYTFDNKGKKPIFEEGEVVTNPEVATELLPAQEGFFFGSTAYDNYYLATLKETISICDRCLALPKDVTFQYQSSW